MKKKQNKYQVLIKANGVKIKKQTKSLRRFLLSLTESGRNNHFLN